MKKIILITSLFSSLFYAQSQNRDSSEITRNELKFNAGYLLLEYAEISYEALLDEESGIGISLGAPLNNEIDYKFSVIPYYRLYFGGKSAAGFFIEANAALIKQEVRTPDTGFIGFIFEPVEVVESNEFTTGIGLAIGGKFLTKRGWIGEVFAGGGRNFINDNASGGYPRLGIKIGKRF